VERVNAAGFARLLGIHKSTVCRAIQSGRLALDADNLLDVASSLDRWRSMRSGMRPDVAERHAAARAAGALLAAETAAPAAAVRAGEDFPAADDSDIDAGAENAPQTPDDGRTSLQHYTAVRLDANNKAALIDIALRTHQRYPLEAIRREAHALGSTLRASLERLVDQTAPLLAITADRAEREAIIGRELQAVRRLLRKSLPRALRSLRSGRGNTR
jgi:hypothetical protein